MSSMSDLSDQEKELIRIARQKGLRPKDIISALITQPEVVKKEDAPKKSSMLESFKETMEEVMQMKMTMEAMKMFGLTQEEKSKDKDIVEEIRNTIKELLSEKAEKGEKLSTSEMMNMIIMLKALGGEKSSDWKDVVSLIMSLQNKEEKKGQPDMLALLDKVQEIESRAKADQTSTIQQILAQLQSPQAQEEGEGESFEKVIGKEAVNAIKENIINTLKENLNPSKKIVNEKGQVDWGAVADKVLSTIQEGIKRIPMQQAPPPSTEPFEPPEAHMPPQPQPLPQPIQQPQPQEQQPTEAPQPEAQQPEAPAPQAPPEAPKEKKSTVEDLINTQGV